MKMVRWFGLFVLVTLVVTLASSTARAAHDWNDAAIAWKGHDDGFALVPWLQAQSRISGMSSPYLAMYCL